MVKKVQDRMSFYSREALMPMEMVPSIAPVPAPGASKVMNAEALLFAEFAVPCRPARGAAENGRQRQNRATTTSKDTMKRGLAFGADNSGTINSVPRGLRMDRLEFRALLIASSGMISKVDPS